MLFGLTNAPAAFQRFMNDVFSDLLDMCIVVYLYDILIYPDDITQHWNHIKEVLKWLHKSGLYAKTEKCEFHSDSVEYLDYILSLSSLTMSDTKVKTIQEWLEPKKIKNIQSFLGFANFYRYFIFNYSDIVIPLTYLTRKDTLWNQYPGASLHLCSYPYALGSRHITCYGNWCLRLHSCYYSFHYD